MSTVAYKEAVLQQVPYIASLRSEEGELASYWENRIHGYMVRVHNPQAALPRRVVFVAEGESGIVGFIAGHLTKRHGCQGELQWINVARAHRSSGVATGLLRCLAAWFRQEKIYRVCVNVAPDNLVARSFYHKHGATDLLPNWLFWNDISSILIS